MNLYISDLHLGHERIIELDNRPFSSVEEMNQTIIKNWNEKVRKNDDVYIIGDVCFKGSEKYLKQLNGRKHLIIGNHDKNIIKNKEACKHFVSIDYYKKIHENGKTIILCHYPIAEWDGFFRDSYHIYGHIHNSKNASYQFMKQYENALNAGCMINNYEPVTLEELIENNKLFKKLN